MPDGPCVHHEAVDVRLTHLERTMQQVKSMFWALIVGMILTLAGLYGNLYSQHNGNSAVAQDFTETVK